MPVLVYTVNPPAILSDHQIKLLPRSSATAAPPADRCPHLGKEGEKKREEKTQDVHAKMLETDSYLITDIAYSPSARRVNGEISKRGGADLQYHCQ
jgi:hypothetical protein